MVVTRSSSRVKRIPVLPLSTSTSPFKVTLSGTRTINQNFRAAYQPIGKMSGQKSKPPTSSVAKPPSSVKRFLGRREGGHSSLPLPAVASCLPAG